MKTNQASVPALRVAVLEPGSRKPSAYERCEIGSHLKFDPSGLASYLFAEWKPLVYDALLLAGAIEYCDRRLQRRPAVTWRREFEIRIPVHDRIRWSSPAILDTLTDAVEFLTGDRWRFIFVARQNPEAPPAQSTFKLALPSSCAIMPYSDGLDSRAAAGLLRREWGDRLILVRLGHKVVDRPRKTDGRPAPFSTVPYRVRGEERRFNEASSRSRGFKFALLSGVAAFLSGARTIFLPESGQGALGSVLVPVGQIYEDYRNHPAFTSRMSAFLRALFDHDVSFAFPRLWSTKGETLRDYLDAVPSGDWAGTSSCWHDTRSVSVNSRKRQCGICAACLLRRMSIHAAKLDEATTAYVWERLDAPTFAEGTAMGFATAMRAHREYGIAGVLHLDHLAELANSSLHADSVAAEARALARHLREDVDDVHTKLKRMLAQHKAEWTEFKEYHGQESFLARWLPAA